MEYQIQKNEHLTPFAFNQGSKATKADHNICVLYGEDTIAKRTANDWYAKFKNVLCFGSPVEFNEVRLNQLLHKNSCQTRELAEKQGRIHSLIS